MRIYSPSTIKSLHQHGLHDANFNDPRGFERGDEARLVRNLDGARFAHSPESHQLLVWTNRRGRELLQQIQRDTGIFEEDIGTMLH